MTMLGTNSRNIKLLGAAWLVGGGVAFAVALFAIAQLIVRPSAAEVGVVEGLVFVLVLLVLGSIGIVNGLALLRRYQVARPLLAVSSLVLLVPSAGGLVSGDIGSVLTLLVLAATLWLTLSKGGKEALESYMAGAHG